MQVQLIQDNGHQVIVSAQEARLALMSMKLMQVGVRAVMLDSGENAGAVWHDGDQWNYFIDEDLLPEGAA